MSKMFDLFEYRPGQLWGSSLPETREDLQKIADAGVKVVVSLESRFGFPDFSEFDLEQHRISIPDFGIPSDDNVRKFVKIVRGALDQGRPVLIHCLAGCGRTGTMMALAEVYLFDSADGQAAIDRVRKSRSCAIETDGQERSVLMHAENPLDDLRAM